MDFPRRLRFKMQSRSLCLWDVNSTRLVFETLRTRLHNKIHNMVNWQLSKQDSHWPYRGLICQLIEVTWFIWKFSTGQLIVLLNRDQCSISYFLASLGAQLIMYTYWTSMLWSIDSCYTEYLVTSITWAYRRRRCRPIEIKCFLKSSADKLLVFKWSQA